LDAVVGRGGLLKGVPSGTYTINEKVLEDVRNPHLWGREHASNLGGLIANSIAEPLNIPSFIVDPVTVDELPEIAKISGVPEIEKRPLFHALNIRYTAHRLAEKIGKLFEETGLIGAHMGGGISVAAIKGGRVVDVNTAVLGSGPFSPQRAGTLPLGDVVDMAYSGQYTKDELMAKFTRKSGLIGYLGTDDVVEIEKRIKKKKKKASLILKAMCYQISKEIGACASALEGKIDSIFLTGGLAYSSLIVEEITRRTDFIAPVHVFPGENEMEALSQGALRVLKASGKAKIYE
ncbi:MAG: butyrate kinase, partial [Deltaproteobacteria bacterium]|nr:butyrate kinase [Deltaproteobacteria bacterium]